MAFTKKEWKDRVSQYPNRRTINDGFQTKLVTVGRSEGTVTEAGDSFNAANMNDLENRINEAFTNIIHTPRVNDKTPYQYRQTPVNANRCLEKLIGVSCAFNQLVQNGNFADGTTNWTSSNSNISASDGVLSFTPTQRYGQVITNINFAENHKYLLMFDIKADTAYSSINIYTSTGFYFIESFSIKTEWEKCAKICLYDESSGVCSLQFQDNRENYDTTYFRNIICIDLTSCFGSEVADYLYNLENG